MRKNLSRILFSLIILLSFSISLQNFAPFKPLAQKTVFAQTSSSGLFGGISESTRNFFEGVQNQFNTWFQGGSQPSQGGSRLPHPTPALTPLPGQPTPTPGPYLNLGDLIQLDASFTASCRPDAHPDELHEAVESPPAGCDWDLPAPPPGLEDIPVTTDADVTTPIVCLNSGGQARGVGDDSRVRVYYNPLIGGADVSDNGDGTYNYTIHWELWFQDNNVNDMYGADGVNKLYGLPNFEHHKGLTFAIQRPGQEIEWAYSWPNNNFYAQCADGGGSSFGYCRWTSEGICDNGNGCCGCACEVFPNPETFTVTAEQGSILYAWIGIKSRMVPRTCDAYDGPECDAMITATDWGEWGTQPPIAMYLGGEEPAPTPEPVEGQNDICTNLPVEECLGCDDTQSLPNPVELDWFRGQCRYPPDPRDDDWCFEPLPDNSFDECPLGTYCDDPLDLCWGLFDPAPGQYDPTDVDVCGGELATRDDRVILSCNYQVPARNVIAHLGQECNKGAHLSRENRWCYPAYVPDGWMDTGFEVTWNAYIRKLNGCNEYFEGAPMLEGQINGVPGQEPPPPHTGYCNNESLICNTTDGVRCVNRDGPNVCRKAIRVETYETDFRSNETPPPSDAFTASCLGRETEGTRLDCEGPNCSESHCNDPPEICDGVACCGGCDVCDPADHACENGTCCSPCDTVQGCHTVGQDPAYCNYPENTDCQGSVLPINTDPCPDTGDWNCADAENCCQTRSDCAHPHPPGGNPNQIDGDSNAARNCRAYEWTKRVNVYTVEYRSNAITVNLDVKNLSSHPVPSENFDWDAWNAWVAGAHPGETLPLENFDPGEVPETIASPHSFITIETELPEFVDYEGVRIALSDTSEGRNRAKDPRLLGIMEPHGNSRLVQLTFSPLPAYQDPENGNAEFTIHIDFVPSLILPNGNRVHDDYTLNSTDQLNYFINELPSDDRLVNLEFDAKWANARSVELLSFWIGQGVLGTASPCEYKSAPCYTDSEALPFGWPNKGIISQNWGGNETVETFDGHEITNPFASIYGPRYQDAGKQGLYRRCEGEWINAGIDIIPSGEETWSPSVFSTHAGYVTHIGENPNYPGRGYYVEIQSTIDDDCQPNFLTRYCNLAPGSIRVDEWEYVSRHKLLGLMGDSGTPGYVHLHYTLRTSQPNREESNTDIPDNNVGFEDDDCDVDPYIDPPSSNNVTYEEPDDLASPSADDCSNPYEAYEPFFCHPDIMTTPDEVRHFCTTRLREDEINSCYYANP